MNLARVIRNLHGAESVMSFPSREMMDALPKNTDGTPNTATLPRETVKNVIVNCLANYVVKDRKEMFYVNTIAQNILEAEGDVIELNKKFKDFLIEILYSTTAQKDAEGKQSGIYFGWVIVQVLDELGVTEDETQ